MVIFAAVSSGKSLSCRRLVMGIPEAREVVTIVHFGFRFSEAVEKAHGGLVLGVSKWMP